MAFDPDNLVGYSDPWSVAPGETIRFMVRSTSPKYRAEIVRLYHGDERKGAPGLKEEFVKTSVEGEYDGKIQEYPVGSYVSVPDHKALHLTDGLTITAWVFPTLPDGGRQGVITKMGSGDSGFGLVVDAQGALALRVGSEEVSTGIPLLNRRWYFVAGSFDKKSGRIRVTHRIFPAWPVEGGDVTKESNTSASLRDSGGPLLISGWTAGDSVAGHFNGKIEQPAIFGTALDDAALQKLFDGALPGDVGRPIGAWDFSVDTPTDQIHDTSSNKLHGETTNQPARGMGGHAFAGGERSWVFAPETHGAINFHNDDIDDCRWEVAFELKVPDSMKSGIYAAKLTAGENRDHLPFYVRPKNRKASSPILFLAPTDSYLAYANFFEKFAQEKKMLGLYHFHADGTAVVYSSRRRPIINFRPGSNFRALGRPYRAQGARGEAVGRAPGEALMKNEGAPHQFNADLHLIDWLHEKGFEHDVATDEDLERERVGLLSQYRVVITGSHPEYWSVNMMGAVEDYLAGGGRLMYLGGNGLLWTISFDVKDQHFIEVRRGGGGGFRASGPGDRYHSTTGELGGYLAQRGRASHRITGVGERAQGFDFSIPYHREPDSENPRAAWIFEGVPEGPIGDFGLIMGGAAGFEIDGIDPLSGTPPHALLIARAKEFSQDYGDQSTGDLPVQADMMFFEAPKGGAVFSVASIAYCGALSHNNYENSISRLTENVLRRFMSDEPIPAPNSPAKK